MFRNCAALGLVLISALAGCSDRALDEVGSGASAQTGGRFGAHGMVVFGGRTIFMSHIPMLDNPHNMQVVFEAELQKTSDMPASFSEQLLTFQPRSFSLDDLASGTLQSIKGTLFRGNFEDGGTAIATDVEVRVAKVVFARVLAPGAEPPRLSYLLVGAPDDASIVHLIQGGPSFDQIAAVTVTDSSATAADFAKGISITIAGSENAASGRLKGTEPVVATIGTGTASLNVAVNRELSCLVGPNFSQGCP